MNDSSPLTVFGLTLVGATPENGRRLLLTAGFVFGLILLSKLLRVLAKLAERGWKSGRVVFWTRQGISLATAILLTLGLLSIWFSDPTRLTTVMGFITAGLAVALQKVVTAVAAYFVILRGRTFSVGDRISMGGVRGDIIDLGFVQTTIMEMGQSSKARANSPGTWVHGRQYTGRIVTVTNDKIFQEPVYNYTREFPFLWDELSLPIPYGSDRRRAEAILLEAAIRHTSPIDEIGKIALEALREEYFVRDSKVEPKTYYRITDNWLELTVRFLAPTSGVRDVKNLMSRDILDAFEKADIRIASPTLTIRDLPGSLVQQPTPS